MLEAAGGPGERSLLSQKRRTDGGGEEQTDQRLNDGESQEDDDLLTEEPEKRESDGGRGRGVSESVGNWIKGDAAKPVEEGEDGEKRGNMKENSEEDDMTKDKSGKEMFEHVFHREDDSRRNHRATDSSVHTCFH